MFHLTPTGNQETARSCSPASAKDHQRLGERSSTGAYQDAGFSSRERRTRRLRLDNWRIVYAVIETDVQVVAVVAVRRRPPYDYGDLPELFGDIG